MALLQGLLDGPLGQQGLAALDLGNGTLAGLLAIGCLTGLGLAWRHRESLYRYLASTHASVVWIGALLLATVLGTVILQATDAGTFAARYGSLAGLLQALTLDDVFHGAPFRALVGGLTLSSVLTVIQRRRAMFRWRHVGLLATHAAVLIIVAGGLWGALGGAKGMVHLRVGEQSAQMVLSSGPRQGQAEPLGFSLRLDKFELAHYVPEYKVYTWRRGDQDQPEAVSSDVPKVGQPIGAPAPGAHVQARVIRVLQRARAIEEQVATGSRAPEHVVTTGGQRLVVAPGQRYDLPGGKRLFVDQFLPEFSYDTARKQAMTRSAVPKNPALVVRTTGVDGQPGKARYLFARAEMRAMMGDSNHGGADDLVYSHTPARAVQVRWVEAPSGPPNPAIELEITENGRKRAEFRLASGQEPIRFGADRILVYREKPDGIRNYKSRLTVLRHGQEVVSRDIVVNDPLYFEDHGLFQSNFDPDDPTYSGIQVVRDPGLGLAIAGLWLLVAGVVHTLALRNWRPRWFKRRQDAETGTDTGHLEAAA